jgi:hypothetical protein
VKLNRRAGDPRPCSVHGVGARPQLVWSGDFCNTALFNH